MRSANKHRAFTLIEIMGVVAVGLVVAGLAVASMTQILDSAKGRASAAEFAEYLRQQRASNILAGNYTFVQWTPTAGGSTIVTISGQATGSTDPACGGTASGTDPQTGTTITLATPCQVVKSGCETPKVQSVRTFSDLQLVARDLASGAPLGVDELCIGTSGQSFTIDVAAPQPVVVDLVGGPKTEALTIDENGGLSVSTNPGVKSGLVDQSFHIQNDLARKTSADIGGVIVKPVLSVAGSPYEPATGDPVVKTSLSSSAEYETLSTKTASGGCFAAGTLVATPDGARPIEALRAGDKVLAVDVGAGVDGAFTVEESFVRRVSETWELVLDGERIVTTSEHPFFVDGIGFVPASQLSAGTRVRALRGSSVMVDSVTRVERAATVYNVHVARAHSYFVGDHAVLVHNMSETR